MKQIHLQDKISDYVLDLLPLAERRLVEAHVTTCAACRVALQQERQIGSAVRDVMGMVRLNSAELATLMPPPPRRLPQPQWQRSFALAMLIVCLFMGNFGFQQLGGSIAEASPSATALAMTATSTIEVTRSTTEIAVLVSPEAEENAILTPQVTRAPIIQTH